MRALLYPLPVLESDRLLLRPVEMKDAADMYDYSRDPETSKYLLWEPHPNSSYTREHIQRLLRQYKSLQFFDWALVEKTSKKMIGTTGFTRISGLRETAEIGYVLSPAFHKKGLAPEAIKSVLAFAFDTLKLKSVFCRIMEDNVPSRKVVSRLGFRFLGFEKEPIIKRGHKQRVARYQLSSESYEIEKN